MCIQVLDPISQQLIDKDKRKKPRRSNVNFNTTKDDNKAPRLSKRTSKKESELFGAKLFLKMGNTSNLYRDIIDLYQFYTERQITLSESFPSLIRMSLRLLCETAGKEINKKLEDYLNDNFDEAKKTLDQDVKTTLATQNVNKSSILQLLHTGAHNYKAAGNIEQTIAVSHIIGAMLIITHGKQE